MKTDSIFYRLFQEFLNIFFELIGNSPETATNYQFSSVEIKQTAFRIDGVFFPQTEEKPIYFVEIQFQTDTEIYSRLFSEINLYLRQNKPKNHWFAVVIYPSRSIDTAEITHYRESFASGRVTRIYSTFHLYELRYIYNPSPTLPASGEQRAEGGFPP